MKSSSDSYVSKDDAPSFLNSEWCTKSWLSYLTYPNLTLYSNIDILSDTYAVILFWDSDVSDINEYGVVPDDEINAVREAYKLVRIARYHRYFIF